jgi:hypothetical protein
MHSSDIQFQLYFLDCQPNSIIRSLNDQSVFDHLYRAATNRILKFDKSYQRKESHRVTDIDQLSSLINPLPQNMTRTIPIEMIKNENRKIENKTSSETDVRIPPAPPLPPSLDLAIKLQTEFKKSIVPSPNQNTLWVKVRIY